ncbi:MAG: tetratricopeptide repeat protein [Puniceicoccaceae bacterium]
MASKKSNPSFEEPALFGFGRITREPNRPVRLRILWPRVFLAFLLLVAAGWFATAGALYFFFKHKHDFEEVSYARMLALPFRMDEHRVEMGDYHVERGMEALEEGELRQALHFLRVGVARSKANAEGRMVLARIFETGLQRPDLAAEILRQGIEHADKNDEFLSSDYLQPLFRLLLNHQFDERIVSLSEELLPRVPPDSQEAAFMALASVQANVYRGNYREAERLLDKFGLTQSPQGQVVLAQIRWNRGLRDRAISILHRALERHPDRDDVFGTLMKFYREQEEWDLVRRYSVLRSIRFPEKVGPRISQLYALQETGDGDQVLANVEEILAEFPAEESAMPLAQFAAETGRPDVGRIAYDLALRENLSLASLTLLLQESLIRGGDYQASLDFSDQLREEKPAWLEPLQALENGLRALALYGLDRPLDSQIFVREFLKSDRIRPQTHIAVARMFTELGAPDVAHDILSHSYSRHPNDQPVLSALAENDIVLGRDRDFVEHLRALLRMRVPDQAVLAVFYEELGSDRHLFLPERETLLERIEELIVRPG